MFQNVANGLSDSQSAFCKEELMHLVREACVASNAHDFIEKLPDVSMQLATFRRLYSSHRVITPKSANEQALFLVASGRE